MPRNKVGREQTVTDVRDMWTRLYADYPGWSITLQTTMQTNGWFVIVARAFHDDDAHEGLVIQARVYNTLRSPSFITDQWKALFGLHMQIERHLSGLPLLIGY